MLRLITLLVAPAVIAAAIAGVALGGSQGAGSHRNATAGDHNLKVAIDDGYSFELKTCSARRASRT